MNKRVIVVTFGFIITGLAFMILASFFGERYHWGIGFISGVTNTVIWSWYLIKRGGYEV